MSMKREVHVWLKALTSILHVCHESRRYECCDEKCDDDESGEGPQLFEPTSSLREIDNMNGVVPRAITTWRGREGERREGREGGKRGNSLHSKIRKLKLLLNLCQKRWTLLQLISEMVQIPLTSNRSKKSNDNFVQTLSSAISY